MPHWRRNWLTGSGTYRSWKTLCANGGREVQACNFLFAVMGRYNERVKRVRTKHHESLRSFGFPFADPTKRKTGLRAPNKLKPYARIPSSGRG